MEANEADIRAHLSTLFPPEFVHPHPDAKIEIAYGTPEQGPCRTEWFSAFKLDTATEFAMARNVEGNNVYVGVALRRGDAAPFGRARDADFLASAYAWIDLDGAGDFDRAKQIAKSHGLKPAMLVMTGTTPHERAHLYFKIDGGITDGDELRRINTSLHELFGSDGNVANPSRLLRVAGTVSYPSGAKRERGYVDEIVGFRAEDPPSSYKAAYLAELVPSQPTIHQLPGPAGRLNSLGLSISRTDEELRQLLEASRVAGQWHNSMLKAVASMVGRGWPDIAVRLACAPYCRDGAGDPDLTPLIEGARAKWDKPSVEVAGGSVAPNEPWLHIRDAAAFAAEYKPADYLIDGLLQTGFLYSLTAPTGTGKTALALMLAQHVADGTPFAGREVQPGRVIYAAGENADELRQRFLALCDREKRDPGSFDIHFLTPRTSKGLLIGFDEVEEYARRKIGGGVRCVIVDTAAAFFDGQDENSNTELGDYARRLRKLADLPGHPAVVVPCHPIKKPKTQDECLPRGGGAFTAEVDGNLTLWKLEGEGLIGLDWAGKFRGPPFMPIPFRLLQVETATVCDAKGRPVKSVVAEAVDEQEAFAAARHQRDQEIELLVAMLGNPGAKTPTALAKACGWLSHVGTEDQSIKERVRGRVRRALKALETERLVQRAPIDGQWCLTPKGRAEAQRRTEGDMAVAA